MSTRPMVTARSDVEANSYSNCTGHAYSTPGVHVEVTFQLHDHKGALIALDRAVADVKAQIQEAS